MTVLTCPSCGHESELPKHLTSRRLSCPHCGADLVVNKETEPIQVELRRAKRERRSLSTAQILALAGCAVLIVGVFVPLLSLPIIGSITYVSNGRGDGIIVLVLVAISGILAMARKYQGLWFTGLASLALMGFTFTNLQTRLGQARAEMHKELQGNPFAGLGEAALAGVQLQWGWAILLIGASLVVSAAIVAEVAARPKHIIFIRVAGAASIPVTLLASGLATWLVPLALEELHQHSVRLEAERQQSARIEQEKKIARELAEFKEAEQRAREEAARKAAEMAAEQARRAEATNQTLVRIGESLPRATDDWADASVSAVQQADIRVRILRVATRARNVLIHLLVENLGTKALAVKPWDMGATAPVLLDDTGKKYLQNQTREISTIQRLISAKQSLSEVLQFEAPENPLHFLRLQLPAIAFGGEGQLRFQIPESMLTFVLARIAGSNSTIGLKRCLSDKDPDVRIDAIAALGGIRPPAEDTIFAISQLLADQQPRVRRAAAAFLGNIGSAAFPVWQNLFQQLADENEDVAQAVGQALEQIGTPPFSQLIALRKAVKGASPRVREAAVTTIGQIGSRASIAIADLVGALKDKDPAVRSAAAIAIGEIGAGDEVRLELRDALKDESKSVRQSATRALAKLSHGPGTVAALLDALNDSEPETTRIAEEALSKLDRFSNEDITCLIAASSSPKEKVRALVVGLLTRAGANNKGALSRLMSALKDPDSKVRLKAAIALGQMGPSARASAKELANLISDSDPSVREAAIASLGSIGPDATAAVPSLLKALANPRLEDQVTAALIKIGKGAASYLADEVEQGRIKDQMKIIPILGAMGPNAKAVIPQLSKCAESDPFPAVRRAAADAIVKIKGQSG